ncbi:uncharacterized protein CIMG_12208 [Coccidioides immitis RS]|uniref:ATP synthase subunit K, mitochondrial n=6 Tax=Coccidioides TaxID=5500 RepID=A0A0D8JTX9_COCIM|nr:uncharacterized protein CIMG_12208 [Coccidioides immitis RS]EFW17941.1 hypothetical protein CPSG_05578 [Coccidioides posadasii str. Silveira]KMM68628.1 hypothetical protein CPAG_04954 [Coccidioides posadasii RMSCC 3488]KMP06916.1 hypothetical protein CIRG_06597 [Coccidioides immitis RMSCC 2394]KMU75197.1 hypothetical protein CISG_04145 [Coccidioides immitis RMSCC 3703]KMU91989.1 hypothetical protein CIHG_09760 [Coccidioides immitis H538.4]TPX22225.1 hypothetical protein DIZ76_014091 [Cocci
MVVYYQVAGRKVGSHVLAMATLGTTFAGAWLAMPSSSKKKEQGPPIKASSKDEEQFIQEFLKNVEAEEKKAKA